MRNHQLLAVVFMVLSMLSYQISASFAKQLFAVLDPLTVTILRLSFASLLVFVIFRSWHILHRLAFLKWRDLLCYSAALCCMNVLFYMSLGKLPQGIAVGLEFIGPLGLALLSIQNRRDYIWVICAILGITCMVPWGQTQSAEFSIFGAVLALGAGLCWAFYIYFGQKVIQQQIGLHALTIGIVLSTLILLPIGIVYQPEQLLMTQYWGHALAIAILATVIPYALDLMALKHLSKLSYGTLSSLSPAIAAITGMILLHERINQLQWFALLLIMIASIGVTFRKTAQSTYEKSNI